MVSIKNIFIAAAAIAGLADAQRRGGWGRPDNRPNWRQSFEQRISTTTDMRTTDSYNPRIIDMKLTCADNSMPMCCVNSPMTSSGDKNKDSGAETGDGIGMANLAPFWLLHDLISPSPPQLTIRCNSLHRDGPQRLGQLRRFHHVLRR